MKTFFYIICRDKRIFEIENTGNRLESSFEMWQKKGLIIFPTLGIAINSADVSQITNEENYKAYIDQVNPDNYVKHGAWYNKDNKYKPYRYEKWRYDSLQIEQKQEKLLSKEQRQQIIKKIKQISSNFKKI